VRYYSRLCYLGEAVNAGHDTGYSQNQKIRDDDPHFGWKLGSFYVDGYTRVTENKTGYPVFLKTVGDTVTLWFELVQDIDKLNATDSNRRCSCCFYEFHNSVRLHSHLLHTV